MKKHLCIYWCNNHNKTEKQADDKQAILPREWLEWDSKWLKVLGQWPRMLSPPDTWLLGYIFKAESALIFFNV